MSPSLNTSRCQDLNRSHHATCCLKPACPQSSSAVTGQLGWKGTLAWGTQGCDPFPQPGHAAPPEVLQFFCAPSPPELCWPAAHLPHTAAALLQFGITSRCALQLASRWLTQALDARGSCLLPSTNTDHPLHFVPWTYWVWGPHLFPTHLLVHPYRGYLT